MKRILSFDIGYASIGWCVLRSASGCDPDFLGTGVVTFPADDCLASERRGLRRSRRHIRSTRDRIERLKRWLAHRGVLTRHDLDRPGHPAPFLLAAAALDDHKTLTAWEFWTVLRWYAHNRGYDGNARWSSSREEEDAEDTQKVSAARALMIEHGTDTMAATVCACLGLDPAEHDKRIASTLPYKTLNAAYPREVVENEVRALLDKHLGKIPGLDAETADAIFTTAERENRYRRPESLDATFREIGIHLPRRFHGGLLFGQLVPRFDNRIIARCPITWAAVHDAVLAGTFDERQGGHTLPAYPLAHPAATPAETPPDLAKKARKLADKYAKVPAAKSRDFLEYRLARVLANIQADGEPLDADTRQHLWKLAQERGSLTASIIEKEIKTRLGDVSTNLEAYFNLHPDAQKQLVLDPARDAARKAEGSTSRLAPIWKHLPQSTRDRALKQWHRDHAASLLDLINHAGMVPADFPDLPKAYEKANKPKRGEVPYAHLDDYLRQTSVRPEFPSGRAPYARPVLQKVVSEVLRGEDPTKPNQLTDPKNGEKKEADGVLYPTLDPSSRVRELQAGRPLPELTNNHLIRHRLLILERLLDDIAAEFPADSDEPLQIVVEVARELKEFSGMSAKQVQAELKSRLKDFKDAVAYLEEHAPNLETNGGIIRKCRVAMDLGWRCPFTGEKFDAYDLPKLEREHIIPYANRTTNALSALVLTRPEVNRMKGRRTARRFIEEEGGKPVPGKANLSLLTLKQYDALVAKLDTSGHDDDRRRKRARKALLATTDFEEKESGFTEGALTQSSQLMKLAMAAIRKKVPEGTVIDPMPGPVTAEIRKSWKLTGTLALACPEVLGTDGEVLPKNEIRGLTHLHHALDAATLGLAAHHFPLRHHGEDQKGKIWQALLKRRRSEEEKRFLLSLSQPSLFQTFSRNRRDRDGNESQETDVRLRDLDAGVKEALSRSLAESRVMQHVPADRSGTRAELTTWGLAHRSEGESVILQRVARTSLKVDESASHRKFEDLPIKKPTRDLLKRVGERLSPEQRRLVERGILKLDTERSEKLLGTHPSDGRGKLKELNGAVIISDNFGLALDPEPSVIPFHAVQQRLDKLRGANGGAPIRLLRNGMLIRIKSGRFAGIWMIRSIKEDATKGPLLELTTASMIPAQAKGKIWSKRDVRIRSALAGELEILPYRYTAHPLTE